MDYQFSSVFFFFFLFIFGFPAFTDLVYLDHAGATLYSDLQMESVFNDLTNNVYGNPRILTCLTIFIVQYS